MLDDGLKLANLIASKYRLTICHRYASYGWDGKRAMQTYQDETFYGLSLVLVRVRSYFSYLKSPKLTILQLQYGAGTKDLPTDFFRGMKNLRILSLVVPSVTQSFTGLRHLQTLRLKVLHLKDLSWIGGLKSLKFLCVDSLSLRYIPKELGQLGSLRLLDFRETELVHIPPGVLSRMLKLEELYLPLSFRRWGCRVEDEDDCDHDGPESREENDCKKINASLCEIASLKLSALQISAQKASLFPRKSSLLFKGIQRFKILVHDGFEYQPNMEGLMNKMQLTGDTLDIRESDINYLMCRTEDLCLTRVRNLKDAMSQFEVNDFPQLKKMIITECEELEYVVATMENWIPHGSFGELKCLHLSMLPNMKEILHGAQPRSVGFENLRQISIRFCHKLKYVFPLSMANGIRQLKSIEILDCNEMEAVFYRNDGADYSNEISFVEDLHLYSLPKFIGFLAEKNDAIDGVRNGTNLPFTTNEVSLIKNKELNSHLEMPSAFSSKLMETGLEGLKKLKIAFCDALRVIFSFEQNRATSRVLSSLEALELHGLRNLEHLLFQIPPQATIFQNLQLLVLSECHNFYVLSPRVAMLLVQLQKIQISRCENMEEIVVKDDGKEVEAITDEIVLPKLRDMELQYMPNLRMFHGGIYAIKMPSLSFLKLNQCSKMEGFCHGSLHTPMLERVQINGSLYTLTEDLNATMKGLKEEKV